MLCCCLFCSWQEKATLVMSAPTKWVGQGCLMLGWGLVRRFKPSHPQHVTPCSSLYVGITSLKACGWRGLYGMDMLDFIANVCNTLLLPWNLAQGCTELLGLPLKAALCGSTVSLGLTHGLAEKHTGAA